MSYKNYIFQLFRFGSLKSIGRYIHTFLIKSELAYEHLLDRFNTESSNQDFINLNLTAIIKTFERPAIVARLIKSIRLQYPHLKIIVVDDSRTPVQHNNAITIQMPYDIGVSAGRNQALMQVSTKYLMLFDDDFIFTRHTHVQAVLESIENHHEIDIVGGEVINLPFYRKTDYAHETLHPTDNISKLPAGSIIGGLPVFDKVPNFYIAKTSSINKIKWDPLLKRLDHADFFTRAKGVLTIVYQHKFKVLHARTPFDMGYMFKRNEIENDQRILQEKYYQTKIE